ncbi:hypothetical protein ACE41H_23400 [Paenibacillus enshidis]|uniref:Uncharacterized protein n=2 Tax=Paenibacillus TaxID=44249 RepID=A0ABV5AZP8_9BACL
MSHTAIVPDHATIRNYLLQHRLPLYFSKSALPHIETYMAAVTAKGYRGKVVDMVEYSDCYRTRSPSSGRRHAKSRSSHG